MYKRPETTPEQLAFQITLSLALAVAGSIFFIKHPEYDFPRSDWDNGNHKTTEEPALKTANDTPAPVTWEQTIKLQNLKQNSLIR